MYESNYSPFSYGQIVGLTWLFNFGMATGLGEGKILNSNLRLEIVNLRLEINLVSHSAGTETYVYIYIYIERESAIRRKLKPG